MKSEEVEGRCLEEVLRRRYARVLEEGTVLPDLILLDGGRGQLNAGVKVLEDVGPDWIPIVALAKRAEGARKGREASVAELASAKGTFARCRWF